MLVLRISRASLVAALAALGLGIGCDVAVAAEPIPDEGQAGVQVLTRGPVHEAFAETVTFDPQPGIVVAKVPPAAIEELPPEQKPDGANVAWISGYWAWDDDGNDFLWVSGIWRALPPGRQWVSGYWGESGTGAQWTSGYWADAGMTEAEYLPEPPESVEAGPNVDAPSPDHRWLPGGWVWQQNRYAWRPGFWSAPQQNWVWIPAHYHWAPRGYVYVNGYWDHEVDRRGVLFAPVSFQQSVYSQQGFSYTPSTVIGLGVFASHLFLRPNYGHYYYGDYYGANYSTMGFQPWHTFNSGRQGYDPIYAQQRWNHRQDDGWERRVQSDFQHRRDHEDARPPRTFAAQQDLVRRGLTGTDKGQVFAQPLAQYTKATGSPVRFQAVNAEDRQRIVRLGQEGRTHRDERRKLEAAAVAPIAGQPPRAIEPTRITLPRSPFVAKGADGIRNDQGPPKTHELPPPDTKVVPKPRPIGQVQPQPGPRPNPLQPPKVEPQPGPRPNPLQPPKVEPQPGPRPNPVQPPKVQPQPQPQPPKVQPQPQPPKVQPQPPKVRPQPQPRVNPPKKVERPPMPPKGGRGEKPKEGPKKSKS